MNHKDMILVQFELHEIEERWYGIAPAHVTARRMFLRAKKFRLIYMGEK